MCRVQLKTGASLLCLVIRAGPPRYHHQCTKQQRCVHLHSICCWKLYLLREMGCIVFVTAEGAALLNDWCGASE
jgi:hypothetical protein